MVSAFKRAYICFGKMHLLLYVHVNKALWMSYCVIVNPLERMHWYTLRFCTYLDSDSVFVIVHLYTTTMDLK